MQLRHPIGAFLSPTLVVGLLSCAVAGGCSSGEPVYVVRGTITYNGNPVTSGVINFFPDEGPPLGGPIGQGGAYEFELPAGSYRVAINAPPPVPSGWREGDPAPQTEPLIPPHFARPDSSGLTLTVAPDDGPVTRDFMLP